MEQFLKKYKAYWGLAAAVIGELAVYSLRLSDRFVDGRFHINWGPPFWLQKAALMHQVNFFKAYLGAVAGVTQTVHGMVASGWYASHPQLIAIPIYVWTGMFGFSEAAIRSLPVVFFVGATALWWFAWHERHTVQEANIFAIAVAIMPVMIEFGSKLDQEPLVWFFLALAAYGYEKFMAGRVQVPYLWMVAIVGMMWSDWSGWIFGVLCGAALFFLSFKHKPSRKLMWFTLLAGVVGAGVVLLQMHLQGSSMQDLSGVYQYRSGTAGYQNFWGQWLQKQFFFFGSNYAWPLGMIGLPVALYASLQKWARVGAQKNGFSLTQYTALIALGTLCYALIVPQATSIHIYYQIFYTACVSAGLVLVAAWVQKKSSKEIFLVLLIISVVGSVWYGLYNWYSDVRLGFGVPADVELLMQLRPLPDTTLVAALTDDSVNTWLDNPNIVYYSGRRIVNTTADKVLDNEYLVVFNQSMPEKIQVLEQMAQGQFIYQQLACSPHFCILKRNENPDYGKTSTKKK